MAGIGGDRGHCSSNAGGCLRSCGMGSRVASCEAYGAATIESSKEQTKAKSHCVEPGMPHNTSECEETRETRESCLGAKTL